MLAVPLGGAPSHMLTLGAPEALALMYRVSWLVCFPPFPLKVSITDNANCHGLNLWNAH